MRRCPLWVFDGAVMEDAAISSWTGKPLQGKKTCPVCRCCGATQGICDGGDEHDERVIRFSRLSDVELLAELVTCEMPEDGDAWELLWDARQARELRWRMQ